MSESGLIFESALIKVGIRAQNSPLEKIYQSTIAFFIVSVSEIPLHLFIKFSIFFKGV